MRKRKQRGGGGWKYTCVYENGIKETGIKSIETTVGNILFQFGKWATINVNRFSVWVGLNGPRSIMLSEYLLAW